MMGPKILRISLVILAGWALGTAGSEPGWTRKRSLAQRGRLNQVLSEGERCWLGARPPRPRAAPQHHLFGVYPSRPGDYLRPYPMGGQGTRPAGRSEPAATGAASPAGGVGLRGTAEQPAASWDRDGPAGRSELRGDDDTYLGDGGSKESLGEAGTRERSATAATAATTFVGPKEPKPETQSKGRAKTRRRRQVVKGQVGAVQGEPGVSPQRLWPRPKHPLVHGVRMSLSEDGIQKGGGDPSWEAESQGGLPVLYFSGRRGRLLLRPEVLAEIPREAFTVEAWVRPEGGQNNPAIIAGVFDNCSHTVSDKGWALGIRSGKDIGRRDARFFFSLRTDRVKKATIVTGNSRYQPGTWTHVAATYDGHRMALYVDGTQVASSPEQSGPLNSPFMASCRSLLLGGDSSEDGRYFRGHLGTLVFWSTALPQSHLRHSPQRPAGVEELASLILTASFEPLEEQWAPFRDGEFPRREVLHGFEPEPEIVSPLKPPLCGRTACDNVELISHYNGHRPLQGEKVIRYRVVNICDDEGLNPTVSEEQISRQHKALNHAFSRYNISWQLSVHQVHNSTLRHRVVLVNCEPSKIGNDHCDPECEHPLTGYDGGDCRLHGRCYSWNRRDGLCHVECNNMLNDFDDGDCCDPEVADVHKTCFDPDSPKRAYMSVKELKEALQLNSTHFLNVYFASSVREDLAGAATWPWDKEAISHLGGVVLNPAYYGMPGHTNIMIHEVGHVLGLYHVFKGVSERESCDDPCRETVPSMDTGDLCADTAPTPKSKLCQDPEPTNDTCGFTHFPGAPFSNYMSYTDDDCTDSFTPNQVARMHCYLDLVYQQWSQSRKPTPIPIPPMVIGQTHTSLTIHWLPPISGVVHDRVPGSVCGACTEDGTFRQYVHAASSRRVCDSSGYWTPEEAVGPPDVDQPCEPSLQAWSPELHLYHMNMTVPCPSEGCSLELLFQHPVQADTLTLWVTYLSMDSSQALFDTEILLEHQESVHLGPLDTFCDTPLTIKLHVDGKVSGVKVYTFDERMEIDAALLTSQPHSPLCSGCRPVRYQVLREPPFANGLPMVVTNPHRKFTDVEVTPGQLYRYQVQAGAGTELGEASPPLSHIHGAPYCGDGKVAGSLGEECDDGDLLSGDGCSRACQLEEGFHCAGEPSLCYIYEGDGICEPFEKETSIIDCGLYTPKGYVDQWATRAYSSHEDKKCPASLVTGEPHSMICTSYHPDLPEHRPLTGWFPCVTNGNRPQDKRSEQTEGSLEREEEVWLKVCFSRPGVATTIFIFLTSDGPALGEHRRPTVTVHLTDVSGNNHSLGTYELSCQHNPLVINVSHHPNVLSHHTSSVLLNFSSPLVGISAVALRTSSHISSSTLNNCIPEHEGQNHQGQSCVHRPCGEQGSCAPLLLDHADMVNCTSGGPGHMKCAITCQRGFALQASSGQYLRPVQKEILLTCSSGHWDRAVSCMPLDCGVPDPSLVNYANFSCSEGTDFLKRCSISCVPPAKLQGLNPWLTCLEDGLWSLPEAYCKLECDAPPVIPNASLLLPHCLQGNHDVGSVCRYECKPGYYAEPSAEGKVRSNFLKIQCLEGGIWEQGSCVPVVCEPPSPVFEGMYECTNGFELNSRCVLSCNQESGRVPILCTKEGLWTEEFKLCENLQGECPPPPSELNFVEYKCEQGYGIGAVCSPSCVIPPSDPVVLPENVTADTLEHWMEPVKVQSIVCTGQRQWHPPPFLIHCIQSCEPFQADGWCDTINNRAYCHYDGGDCCSSTLSSKKVIPFAADCDLDECTCRDPKAEENQ
ncbi:pappalysin-2 isoform X1 [Felis catus]|uniref:Sushi domain-containing protein n=1 Tax=Felis catus TaxID=9685 RepID=A0ABI7WIY2_FELCA|nr:pappalysin-2 isoform X1 [Felis catus]XP_044904338.1 pappalysin-2 isoform X1 [Felis catus]XP_044904339.1 pappalysin-2 isoform X1 [Felis catus]XP_044904340.1 pappalysin-2 isoform X1 [Felis catus]XP_044904341.1 pappalysin-2 isoform X1 [Felis catus]XP_044904342.1 pappalysin-2 isoform X1 [Felis catus]XP_044904343.1 pappalysin-2 isoform X1 [Felis catus]XP_044904344.1 pappalysin-2 isoform X1 [Felis catus]